MDFYFDHDNRLYVLIGENKSAYPYKIITKCNAFTIT